jgi:hypothetical protein
MVAASFDVSHILAKIQRFYCFVYFCLIDQECVLNPCGMLTKFTLAFLVHIRFSLQDESTSI